MQKAGLAAGARGAVDAGIDKVVKPL